MSPPFHKNPGLSHTHYLCNFQTVGCWRFKNALFLDTMPTIGNDSENIPTDLHMMQHVFRAKIHFPVPKSISNTDTALILGQHEIYSCLEGVSCVKFDVDTEVGHNQHYRKQCLRKGKEKECEDMKHREHMVKDARVWTHLETIVRNAKIALQTINLD